jgi:hypothetical protein
MVAIVKITPELFDDIYRDQLREWNPRISETHWRRAFQAPPAATEDHTGYALTDGPRVVGVHGMLYYERQIAGQTIRMCNLHSWRVDPEYRVKALMLLKPIAALQDHTVTDMTAHLNILPIMKRIGMRALDGSVRVLPALPWHRPARGVSVRLLTEPAEAYRDLLSPEQLVIYQDHQGLECGHLLVQSGHETCYVVYSVIENCWKKHSLIHYISSPRLFAEHHAAIRAQLARHGRKWLTVVDSRLLAGERVPYSFRYQTNPKLFRSNELAPHQIDSLYTEQAILKHTSLGPMRDKLQGYVDGVLSVFKKGKPVAP